VAVFAGVAEPGRRFIRSNGYNQAYFLMPKQTFAAVILAAGKGTRMKSALPKVMHPLAGQPMLSYVVAAVTKLKPERTIVVIGREMDDVAAVVLPNATAIQDPPRGTGDAVLAARASLKGFMGDVLVVFGDTPFLTSATMRKMIAARRKQARGKAPAVVVLGMRPDDPGAYGRLVTAGDGSLEAIVEYRDASPAQRRIGLVNSGVMAIDGRYLFKLLDRVGTDNAQGECYLTDIIGIARAEGLGCAVVEGANEELLGINSRAQLAEAEGIVQGRLRAAAMAGGVTMLDPASVSLSFDTRLGRDVVIEPNVFFGPRVRVADNVTIKGFSHIEETTIDSGATIGPYARLRPGAAIGAGAHIGNFVEVKKSEIEPGAKVNHLTYIGDARVGRAANIGAGTITCNYDGFTKSHTDIGAGAFIGSNSSLVAPVKVGEGAVVGAGSVITHDVPADALGVTRAPQRDVAGWAARNRKAKQRAKAGNGSIKATKSKASTSKKRARQVSRPGAPTTSRGTS